MGTKNNPGNFDCYGNAEDDEPMFILLARDSLAPILVRLWADMRASFDIGNVQKCSEAELCATAMEIWKSNNPDQGH